MNARGALAECASGCDRATTGRPVSHPPMPAQDDGTADKLQGNANFKQALYVEAIGHYSRAVTKNPANETFYLNRCQCYLKLNKCAICVTRMHQLTTELQIPGCRAGCFEMPRVEAKTAQGLVPESVGPQSFGQSEGCIARSARGTDIGAFERFHLVGNLASQVTARCSRPRRRPQKGEKGSFGR